MNDNFEVIKAILIHWLNQKLLRKDVIDAEIKRLSRIDDSEYDIEITRLEKKVSQKLGLIGIILHHNDIKRDKIQLTNLKIQKTLFCRMRDKKIDELLQEKEKLAYNEYNYTSRIEELLGITKIEDLTLTLEEVDLLERVLPADLGLDDIFGHKNKK